MSSLKNSYTSRVITCGVWIVSVYFLISLLVGQMVEPEFDKKNLNASQEDLVIQLSPLSENDELKVGRLKVIDSPGWLFWKGDTLTVGELNMTIGEIIIAFIFCCCCGVIFNPNLVVAAAVVGVIAQGFDFLGFLMLFGILVLAFKASVDPEFTKV